MTDFGSGSSDPTGRFSIGNQFGKASSSGLMRVGLFLGTNLAVVAVATVLAAAFGINPSGILGITIFSVVIGMGGSFISLLMSKSMAKRGTGAQVITEPANEVEQWLLTTVRSLSDRAGIGMPEVAVFPSDAPNAFATGAKRDDALVAVSTGLMRAMDRREVEAVLAHEVAHIANGDMITLSLIQGVTNSIVILVSRIVAGFVRDSRMAYFAVLLALQFGLGLLASMIVMWFSRKREYRADAGAAALVGPAPMIAALARLDQASGNPAQQELPDEIAAFGIRSKARQGLRASLFSSHPSIESRIQHLQNPEGLG